MRLITVRHLRSVGLEAVDAVGRVLVATPENEILSFDGCAPEEVDAKLREFRAWTS